MLERYAFCWIRRLLAPIRPLSVKIKEGTIVWGAARCTGNPLHVALQPGDYPEAIVAAIAPACPERAMAGWENASELRWQLQDPRNGHPSFGMFHATKYAGASSGGDGWHGSGGGIRQVA